MWEVIEPGVTLVPNWHIEYICDQLQDVYERWELIESQPDVLINVPPGSSKSTIVTQCFPAWLWVRNKSIRIISSSYSADLSTAHAIKSRDILASEKFTALFGKTEFKRDQSGKTHYKNRFGGERFVTSTGGMVTGMHADFIIDDDPINPKQAASQASLETAKEFSTRTLPSRKTDKKRTVTIRVMQRLHDMDPAGIWLSRKTKKLRHICLPGRLSDNVRPVEWSSKYINGLLDINRLDEAALQEMMDDLGSLAFAQQIQQITAPEEGGYWKRGWFRVIPDHLFPSPDSMTDYGTDWDTAYTDKQTNDANGWCTSGKIEEQMYIDKLGYKRAEFPDMIRLMLSMPQPAYIEAKASGKSAVPVLKMNQVIAIEVQVVGGDKIARTKMATPPAEAGLINIRESLISLLYDDHEQGILHFPNSKHDDMNDALVQAIQRHFKKKVQWQLY